MATTAAARPRREPLTQDRIAKTSLELIDDIGIEDFSTRRLGAALGCEAMAIYNHFASKDVLLDAVVDRLIKDVSVPPKGLGWEDRVRGFARSYRALAHAHPKAFPLLATRRFRTRARNLVEQIIGALLEEGFTPEPAATLFRILANYCNGAILDELSGSFPGANEDHPNIQRVQTFLSPEHYDAIYERGLTLIIEGFSSAER
ncbi:MAG TPA: TetR/AcrR family transcriptional regulator C-terminal domain-containing protein [Polyangiaceae bacterium]|jgi:AcrR family transcriptional regulator|nr:TetR/AcrR family transcriptional regulator C-terminal domain-containing protein [Polyangiaceae bacterium]